MRQPKLRTSCQSCTLDVRPHPFVPQLSRRQCQEILIYLFVGAVILMLALSTMVAYRYMIPQPQWVKLGNVKQFSATQPTRVDIDVMNVWVVNTGKGLTVLHSIPNDVARCGINWEPDRQKFADPCRGTHYTMAGVYAFDGPPPIRSLGRYPIRVDATGALYAEITKPILGLSMEELKEACIAQQKGPIWYFEINWHHFCDVGRIGNEQE